MTTLEFRWTVSRGRATYGWNICSLYVDGEKAASCNGGGYDMKGTALGSYIARAFRDRLMALKPADMPAQSHGRYFYGLTFHDPDYDAGKAVIGRDAIDHTLGQDAVGKTIEQAEAEGMSLGLERYQAFYSASSKVPSATHTVPSIDGGCGFSSVEAIMKAIGLSLKGIPTQSRKGDLYTLEDTKSAKAA